MCKGIGSLVEYGRKLMAWRDVKRDREKKVDDFFAPNGGFDEAIGKINKNVEARMDGIGYNLKEDMSMVKNRLDTMNSKIQTVEGKIDVMDAHVGAIQEGLKTELFESLHQLWRECYIEQHYATIDQKDRADKIYQAYHDFNGNGPGTRIYNEIISLPTQDSV